MTSTKQNSSTRAYSPQPEHMAKALLIEEDRKLDNLFVPIAKKRGYLVDIAQNGKIAIQKIKEKDYDVILLDIDFAQSNGLDLIPELQMVNPDIKIISITANNPKEVEIRARRYKVIYHLIKPFEVSELSSALNHIAVNIQKERR